MLLLQFPPGHHRDFCFYLSPPTCTAIAITATTTNVTVAAIVNTIAAAVTDATFCYYGWDEENEKQQPLPPLLPAVSLSTTTAVAAEAAAADAADAADAGAAAFNTPPPLCGHCRV